MITRKLDPASEKEWEESIITKGITSPRYNDLLNFLSDRCQLLEAVTSKYENQSNSRFEKVNRFEKRPNNRPVGNASHLVSNSVAIKCAYCKESHPLYTCSKLKALPVASRYAEIRALKLCTNCLRSNHGSDKCIARGCKYCNKRHNTMLHSQQTPNEPSLNERSPENAQTCLPTNGVVNHCIDNEPQILLATASVFIQGGDGNWHRCRALIDNGSMPNIITRELSEKLNLTSHQTNIPITGVGKSYTRVSNKITTVIKSLVNEFSAKLSFLVLEKITENLPLTSFKLTQLNIPDNVVLADTQFNESQRIDLLLGAGIYHEMICAEVIKLGSGLPILQKTVLGYIVSGPINENRTTSAKPLSCNLMVTELNQLSNQIERFWKVEECSVTSNHSIEERECEDNFTKTTYRDETGHFIVTLPIKESANVLGESFNNAYQRLQSIERKFKKNEEFKWKYTEFIIEYEQLGHMSEIPDSEFTFYLPHHGVINEASSTTKLRVVFDGSCKTSTGVSLNDILKIGPPLGDDLFDILIRFRKHNYALIADCEKMYRQINITPKHRDLQRIVWRTDSTQSLKHFRLNTVTYGTAPAAYLAVRCLQQAALESSDGYPEAANAIISDCYVDDLITGSNDIESLRNLKTDIAHILQQYGFNLRKWKSNDPRILAEHESVNDSYHITDNNVHRVLGINWRAQNDMLNFHVDERSISNRTVTKRTILATISSIFDPLGLAQPVIITAKILLQGLWQAKVGWDETPAADIVRSWNQYRQQLPCLNLITQPRQVTVKNPNTIELHGFCDSSERAYGACIYIKSSNANGETSVRLLAAKSRVAPLKVISLPRLELCGALLLTQLYNKISKAMKLGIHGVHFWTDSTIVLSWISASSNSWKAFVANRVTEIQATTSINQWHHVASSDNPADVVSRGIYPRDLINHSLWFCGPSWLARDSSHWPINSTKTTTDLERRNPKIALALFKKDFHIIERYSTLSRLLRVTALCQRFCYNLANPTIRKTSSISNEELNSALLVLIKISQAEAFQGEVNHLKSHNDISKKSKLLPLSPFLDKDQVLRLGGRLSKAKIDYDQKFPIILDAKHHLTKLIVMHEHHRQLHASTQTLLASLRQRYWPLGGRRTIRSILRQCITCFRVKPSRLMQKMGALPLDRVSQHRPFLITGVDMAGPFLIKDGKLRNRSFVKSYLWLFICFTTKAVHLELVGDLTIHSFLNALKRFVSRRGLCKIIYSDNGTNFAGANSHLKQVMKSIQDFVHESSYTDFFATNGIEWRFSPPHSPHHGGLWESSIKRAKYHLYRIIGSSTSSLTFEDLTTIFTQVEAVLNSRPLCPLSEDPEDLSFLTPSHFLIHDSLTSIPQADLTEKPPNLLKHYEALQRLLQTFWKKWSLEYLTSLQPRTKWHNEQPNNLKVGSLVLLADNNLPPLCWKIGRVMECHPGSDGIVRVVTVKTAKGTTKRAIQTLAMFPEEEEEASSSTQC
nr:unnamed protein product [Callosobruchus analis]